MTAKLAFQYFPGRFLACWSVSISATQRPWGKRTVSTLRNAHDNKGKVVFRENATLFRRLDHCTEATRQADFEFLTSRRDLESELSGRVYRKDQILDHNLPDRGFICNDFISRLDIIQKLWAWLSDEFQYTKVLAGEGGRGKTSVAYEFCTLLASSAAK